MRNILAFLSIVLLQIMNPKMVFAGRKILDVPYSQQFQAFTCGHESLRTVLAYWGKRESREEILKLLGANGTSLDEIERLIKKKYRDFRFEYVPLDFASIKAQIDLGRPIMLGADAGNLSYLDYDSSFGHMIIVMGYDDSKNLVFIRDSNSPYVEEMNLDQFKLAAFDDPKSAVIIYKPNVTPSSGTSKLLDKSFPVGTKKDDRGIPVSWLVPALFVSYETEPRLNLSKSFRDSSKRKNRKFALLFNGLGYGDLTLEQTPWLGNGKTFSTLGFGVAWVLGSRLRLGPGELLSPGVYSFGRHRLMDVHNFSAIKRIPSLLLRKNSIEVTGYVKSRDEATLTYQELDAEVVSWSGARVGWRRGISPWLGHLSAGVSAGKVDLYLDPNREKLLTAGTINFDLNLGVLKGSLQTADLARVKESGGSSRDGFNVNAYSIGFDYDLSIYRFGVVALDIFNYLGLLRPHVEMNHEIVRRVKDESSPTVTSRRWDIELPVPLHYVDMTYGAGIRQTLQDGGSKDSLRSAWVRFAFNAYQPFVQLTAGYQVSYKNLRETIGQQMSLGVFAGI